MTTETLAKTGDRPLLDVQFASDDTEILCRFIEGLGEIMDNLQQIRELRQSVDVVSHEIVEGLGKVLQLNDKTIWLETTKGSEIAIHPNGYVMARDEGGHRATTHDGFRASSPPHRTQEADPGTEKALQRKEAIRGAPLGRADQST